MAGAEQFDEYLGGSQKLPSDVHILKLISSRASEIAAMTYSIENPQQTKLLFQKLPVYMRRRVMSHNAKRLPRRLREAHLNQMIKSGLPPKSKRPSRRYRRRPRNLLAEYNRRKRNKIWLETHIWHAKRFHMVEKWGYRIASHANDKCFRANYRAVAKHCLIQDISYYTCVEINGLEDVLKDTLRAHCNPMELTFGAKVYITGIREGTLMFFKKHGYPRSPIGHVHFLWRPCQNNLRTLWIWVHPSFFADFLPEIVASFEFKQNSDASPDSAANTSIVHSSYTNDRNCTMNVFQNAINRFRFYGPLAINVLTTALQLPKLDEKFLSKTDSTNVTELDTEMLDVSGAPAESANVQTDNEKGADKTVVPWHFEYYSNQENLEILKSQKQLWQVLKTLESFSQLPPNIVLGFTVLDPRFYLPEKRTKTHKEMCCGEIMPVPPTNANSSPIWEREIRQRVTKSCVRTSAINKLKSQCLVPGLNNDKYFNEEMMAKIPILLIQKPGISSTGLSSGVDIIFPEGWAMPFWLAFIFRCARVGALRESKSVAFEYKNTKSPDINEPDMPAYTREALSTRTELIEKYFRYPPNRRVNFVKLGISSPFFCKWKMLMKEWTSREDFFVLRNPKMLLMLQTKISGISNKGKNKASGTQISNIDLESYFEDKNCLIRVKLSIVNKGCPKRFAIICMPTSEDIEKFENNHKWSGPVETLHSDSNQSTRKTLRKNHLTLLKRLKRQRIRRRKALLNNLNKMLSREIRTMYEQVKSKNLLGTSPDIIQNQSENMSRLYLPECTKVRHSCDREVMGYLTTGDFSFTDAKGIGLGYVTLSSLIELVNKGHNSVLVRNIQTRQYRIANLEIIY